MMTNSLSGLMVNTNRSIFNVHFADMGLASSIRSQYVDNSISEAEYLCLSVVLFGGS